MKPAISIIVIAEDRSVRVQFLAQTEAEGLALDQLAKRIEPAVKFLRLLLDEQSADRKAA